MFGLLRNATLGLLTCLAASLAACSSETSHAGHDAAAGATGTPVGCSASDGDAYSAGIKKTGVAGRLEFALVSSTPAPPALNDNRFIVQVSDAEGSPVEGELSVTLDMPEHGHPSPEQPEISFDPDSQTFTLDPMRLFMVGLWRITFSVADANADAPVDDSAVFEFCID